MSQRNNKKFIEERKKSSNLNIGCDIKEIIDKDENKLVLNGGFIYSYKKFNGFDKGYKAKGNFNSQGLREGKWVEQLKDATIECFYKDGIKKGKATIKNKNYELSGNFINNRIFKGKGIYTKNNKKYFIDDGIFEFQHFVYVYNDIELSSSFYVDSFPCIVREQNSNEKYILYHDDDILKKENVKLDTKEDKKKKTKTIEIEESIFGKVLYEFDSNGNLNSRREGDLHEPDDLYKIERYNKNCETTFKGYCDKDNKNVVGVEYEGDKVVFEGRYQNGKRYIGLGYDKSGKKNFYIASNNPITDLQEKCLNNEGGDLNQKLYAKDFNKIENENQNIDKKDNYVFGVMRDNDKQYIGGFKYIDGEYVKDGECVEYSQEKNKIFFTTYKDGEKVKGKEYGGKGVLEFKGEYKYGIKWDGECKNKSKKDEFKGKYKDGQRYEKGKEYDQDGNLIFEGEFLNGVRNGKGKEYRTNGEVIFQGEYKDGKRWEGKVKKYYNDKLYFKGEYKDGKPYKGIEYNYNFNNRVFEGEYKDGVPYKGKWYNSEDKLEFEGEKQYDNDLKKDSYKNGKRYIYYNGNNNDDCKINTEIEYKEYGMKKIKQYYKSGNIKREYNTDNKNLFFRSIFLDDINKEHFMVQGTFKEYYDNGKLKTFKYYYNNDDIPDYQISYYDNGNIEYECYKDEFFGRYYSEDGKVIGVGKKDGECNFFKYNEDGTISYKYRDKKQNISELTFKYNDEKYIDTIILKKYNKDNGELLKTYDVRKIFKKYIIDNSIIDEEFFINELQMNVRNYKPALDDFKRLPIPYRLAFVEELTNLFMLKGGYDIGTPTSRFFSSIFNGESYRTFLKQQQFNENITNIAKRALNDEKKETKEEISEEQYIKNYKQNIKNVILKCFGLEHLIINPSQENINEFYKKKAKEEKIEDDYEEQEDTKIKESNLILSQNSVIDTNTKKPTPDTLKPTKNKEPAIKLTNRQIEDSLIEKGMPAPINNSAPPIMQEEKIKEPIAVKLYNRKKNDEYFKQYNNDCKNVKISYTIEKQLDSAFKDAIDLNPGCCGCGSL